MYPAGTDSASTAQGFVSLSPGLQKKASVFFSLTTKNTVLAVTQIGSASVLQNLIKALKSC